VDEVAGGDEGAPDEAGQMARCAAERAQPIDLLRYTAERDRRRAGRLVVMQQVDSKVREEAIQRVRQTEIRALDTRHIELSR